MSIEMNNPKTPLEKADASINQQPAKEVEDLKQELKELEWRAVAYHTTLKRVAEYEGKPLPRTIHAEVEERVKTEPLGAINQQPTTEPSKNQNHEQIKPA